MEYPEKLKNHMVRILCFIIPLTSALASGEIIITKKSVTVVDKQGLIFASGTYGRMINGVSFQQEVLVTHNGYQYCGYYNKGRKVCLARRRLPDSSWKTIVFEDYTIKNTDIHNTISIGICPADGTVHLAFDHHNQPLHYKISSINVASQPGNYSWIQADTALFSSVRDYLIQNHPITGVTYPRFFQTPEGKLQFEYRVGYSGNGDCYLADYEPGPSRSWKNVRCYIERSGSYTDPDTNITTTSRNAYLNGLHYDRNGRLHATWAWRSSGIASNHDLDYAGSDDRGLIWKNNTGTIVAQYSNGTATKKITVTSPGIRVWPLSLAYGQMNQLGQCVDGKGQIHVITYHRRKKGDCNSFAGSGEPYFHYWRDIDGAWHKQEIGLARGNRPKVFADKNGNLIVVTIVNSALHLYAATESKQWSDWHSAFSENGPFDGEPLGDYYRFERGDSILSIFCPSAPLTSNQEEGRPLNILDFKVSSSATPLIVHNREGRNNRIHCRINGDQAVIQADQTITDVRLYTTSGAEIMKTRLKSAAITAAALRFPPMAGSLCLLHVALTDGTSRTIPLFVKH